MNEAKEWYVKAVDGNVYGPASLSSLVTWAKDGRIEPTSFISQDRKSWRPAQAMSELEMKWLVEVEPGKVFGPFNRAVVIGLFKDDSVAGTAKAYRLHEFAIDEDPPPVEKIVEKEVIKEVRVEVPVEKIVVDETRVKELEGLLAEERRHADELRAKVDETSRNAAEAAKSAMERESALKAEIQTASERAEKLEAAVKDSVDRENKLTEQISHLEDELRRLPQAASEVADIQAAVYSLMKGEAEELGELIDREKAEFEEIKRRYAERTDRLTERRREMLERAGANIEDMMRKALLGRPEDPRAVQLRKEFEELGRKHDQAMADSAMKIRELTEQLRQCRTDEKRNAESMKDVTQLRQEVQELRERLQTREKDLMTERQVNEELRRQQATKQQVLLARLATLESPSIGTAQTMATNQSREARQVKLPGWMHLGR